MGEVQPCTVGPADQRDNSRGAVVPDLASDAQVSDIALIHGDVAAATELGWPSHREIPVERWRAGIKQTELDKVVEEVPVALVYNGQPHVVMLTTPLDLEDFALGFSLTEGIVQSVQEVSSVRTHYRAEGIEVRVRIPEERFQCLSGKERNLTGRTGCGLCGSATLRQAVRHPAPVGEGVCVTNQQLRSALQDIRGMQALNGLTGSVHAAAWAVPDEGILKIREDVGRHNALDKLIGVLAKTRVDTGRGFAVVTSRASYEMVQKCAVAGITLMVAISGPTGLAIRLAEETGITLIGFARDDSHVVYANPRRLVNLL